VKNHFVLFFTFYFFRGIELGLIIKKMGIILSGYTISGCSAAWLAHLNGVQVAAGSNPVTPTIKKALM